MTTLVQTFFAFFVSCFRSRAVLQIENTMLRHQLNVYAAVRQSRDFAHGPVSLGLGIPHLAWMAKGVDVMQASNSDRLATQTLP